MKDIKDTFIALLIGMVVASILVRLGVPGFDVLFRAVFGDEPTLLSHIVIDGIGIALIYWLYRNVKKKNKEENA